MTKAQVEQLDRDWLAASLMTDMAMASAQESSRIRAVNQPPEPRKVQEG